MMIYGLHLKGLIPYADLTTGEMGAIVNDVLISSDTLQSIENINYITHHDATVTGDDDDNRLSTGSGDDTIYGGAGDDTLINGSGNDFIYGQMVMIFSTIGQVLTLRWWARK